ncbi:MAG: hypothetical protein U0359_10190 [Byssovorax sp.]
MGPCLPRTLILADLHLVRDTPKALSHDLARFVEGHPGARIIVAGDLFDLPSSLPRMPRNDAVAAALGAHPEARRALGDHLDRGGELWLLGGNHDAEMAQADFHEALLGAIGPSPEGRRRVRTSPWFFREGGLHVEHGHLYDPDNAPAHPLVVGRRSLGVHFVEEFVAPAGAQRYLQANDGTPLELFLSSFRWYGPRAPLVIYRYFRAAFQAVLRSGPFYTAGSEIALGRERALAFAEELGLDAGEIERILALGATPTMESLSRTFTRLYFDRVIATVAMSTGLGALAAGKRAPGALILGLGALLMGASWAAGHDRYRGTVSERLSGSAAAVRGATGASLVVFGHTHREALDEGYANTGSFAFPAGAPGRPYLEIEGDAKAPRAVRRYFPASA